MTILEMSIEQYADHLASMRGGDGLPSYPYTREALLRIAAIHKRCAESQRSAMLAWNTAVAENQRRLADTKGG